MGEISPTIDQHPARLPSLPTHGRRPNRLALGIAGAAALLTTAAGCVPILNGLGFGKGGETPSPAPSGIVEHSPIPTLISSESPIVLPTPEVTASPTEAPTLSPADQLKYEFAKYTGGVDSKGQEVEQTNLPDKGRFALFAGDEKLAPANALAFNGVIDADFKQPMVEVSFQGYLLDERVVKASDNKNYLIAYMVQESAPSKDGTIEQYILSVNLGCVDADSKNQDYLQTGVGMIASQSSPNANRKFYSVADMQKQITVYNGTFVRFALDVITEDLHSIGYDVARTSEEIKIQNAVAKDLIEFSKQTHAKPLSQVPQSNLVSKAINKEIKGGFDVSKVPGVLSISTPEEIIPSPLNS